MRRLTVKLKCHWKKFEFINEANEYIWKTNNGDIMIKKLLHWLLTPITRYKKHKAFKKRIAELRKKDPFIYR